MTSIFRCLMIIYASLITSTVRADSIDFSGYLGADLSYFPNTGLYPGQLGDLQYSLVLAPEINWQSDSGNTQINVLAFGRIDSSDTKRQHIDLREGYLRHEFDDFTALIGVNKVFWGVAESRRLVDIINQVDQLEYTDNDARLGQPMLTISTDQDWGALSGFLMTGFRKLEFAGTKGRLRLPYPVSDSAVFSHTSREKAKDYALRYYNSFGDFDLGLSTFNGTSREAVLKPVGGNSFQPNYSRITQTGLDLQYTGDSTLLKLEAITRSGDDFKRFEAMVAGLEYTIYQVADTDADLGFIAEYNYDNRGTNTPQTIFQKDAFVGGRWVANDSEDTSAVLGMLIDLDDGTRSFQGEFNRRLANGLSLKMQFRALGYSNATNAQDAFRRDDFLAISLKHFF